MQKLALLALLFGLASCSSTPPGPGPMDSSPQGQLATMTFLAGSWLGENDGKLWEAHYTAASGGILLGITKRYDENRKVDFFEFETFSLAGDRVVASPYVMGHRGVPFAATKIDPVARRATFENPDHEPQTLDYWRQDEDTLVISVTSPIKDAKEGEPQVGGFRVVLKRL